VLLNLGREVEAASAFGSANAQCAPEVPLVSESLHALE
jgi:hypothetical protein